MFAGSLVEAGNPSSSTGSPWNRHILRSTETLKLTVGDGGAVRTVLRAFAGTVCRSLAVRSAGSGLAELPACGPRPVGLPRFSAPPPGAGSRLITVRTGPRTPRLVLSIPAPKVVTDGGIEAGLVHVSRFI